MQEYTAPNMRQGAFNGILWMSGSTTLQAVLQIIVLAALARLLARADFGLVGAAATIIGLSSIFSLLGIGPAIIQCPSLTERHIQTGLLFSVLMGVVFTCLAYFLAPIVAIFYRMPELLNIFRWMALSFLIQSFGVVPESTMIREMRFRPLAIIQVISYIIGYIAIGITSALIGFGVWALVAAHLSHIALKTVLLLLTDRHRKALMWDYLIFKKLISFGGGFTLARIANYFAYQGDNIVVGRWLGADALGVYSRAYQIAITPTSLFGSVLDNVLFPIMSRLQSQPELLTRAFRIGVSGISMASFPVSGLVLILAPEIVDVLLGPKWIDVIIPLKILVLGLLFRASYKICDSLIRSLGAVYRLAERQIVFALLIIIGAIIGQQWGIEGVALAVMFALAINAILMAHLALALTRIKWQLFLKLFKAPLLLAGCTVGIAQPLALLTRSHISSSLLIIFIVGITAIGLCIALIYAKPTLFLYNEMVWWLGVLAEYFPSIGKPLDKIIKRLIKEKSINCAD